MERRQIDMHVYVTGPIDYWDGWMTVEDFLSGRDFQCQRCDYDSIAQRDAKRLVELAKIAFTSMGSWSWEGDGEFRVSMVLDPENLSSAPIIAVKQSNNGQCYFACDRPIPQLEPEDRHFVKFRVPT